jgi:hypothetical protein
MRARSNEPGKRLELKAIYAVAELAHAVGVTPFTLLRLLRANGVELVTAGRAVMVPVTEIEARLPALWRSLVTVEKVRAGVRAPGE